MYTSTSIQISQISYLQVKSLLYIYASGLNKLLQRLLVSKIWTKCIQVLIYSLNTCVYIWTNTIHMCECMLMSLFVYHLSVSIPSSSYNKVS